MAPLIPIACVLLAIGSGSGRSGRRVARGAGRGRGRGGNTKTSTTTGRGRKRYTRDGIKKKPSTDNNDDNRQEELYPLPPLTIPNGPRPSYFTCRHSYEHTLIDEIESYVDSSCDCKVVTSSPYPGLVRVEDDDSVLPTLYDPVYALQCLPSCVVISAESIKGFAREVLSALLGDGTDDNDATIDEQSEQTRQQLRNAPRGSLSIHPLVPGMCKGQTNPIMQHRSTKVSEEISKLLKKSYPAARKASVTTSDDDDGDDVIQSKEERWVLQFMLQSPNIAVASITKSKHIGPGINSYWPNIQHPLGLAKVDIVERMPSSAYRKLMEGIECMGIYPTLKTTVVDLGACPGGWTSVIRRYFSDCKVIAVDRSELDPALMNDNMVEFIKGDAFTYQPPNYEHQDYWMISDIIAYPERITDLLKQWCSNKWASNMIVTMKFQGNEPDLNELDTAIQVVKDCGYVCRVKHFFNNKNEVTFMVSSVVENEVVRDLDVDIVGTQMYPSL